MANLLSLYGAPEEEDPNARYSGAVDLSGFLDMLQMYQGGSQGSPGPRAPSNGKSLRALAQGYGWTGDQFAALKELMARESGGNRLAQNPTSSAFGRWQFLDSTWAGVGGEKTKNRYLQDIYGLKYIANRYGSPVDALAHHDEENWY